MTSREKVRFCYKTYHTTGEKVVREGKVDMELNRVVIEECKIMEDVVHSLDLYELMGLESEEEIREGINAIQSVSQRYRHIHVELKNLLGDEEHDVKYPLYKKNYDILLSYGKDAKMKIRDLKSEIQKNSQNEEVDLLENDLKILISKVAEENLVVDPLTILDEHEIDSYVTKMEKFNEEFFQLKGKMSVKCPDFERRFEDEFLRAGNEIRQDIKMAKLLKSDVLKKKAQQTDSDNFQREQASCVYRAENLKTEISFRFKSLSKKFDPDLMNLSDYQVLDIQQDKSLNTEFNDILEKVTELAALVPSGGQPVQDMLTKVCRTRDRIASKKDIFLDKLGAIVAEREITFEKLKNASELEIKLPKFSGYNGQIDFFTFKSEFSRLIEPTVLKKFWVDHLKRNYLEGQALTLIESETDYEKIWTRLKESFGSPRIMLQNKLSLIDEIGKLYAIKGDKKEQKLGAALAKLCNSMQDLGKLAKQHDLEGQLYEGGGLEKVMSLIGETRHRRFRSENLNVSLSKKQEWQKLQEFLGKEQILTDRLVLDQKNAELMGFSLFKPNMDKKSNPKSGVNRSLNASVAKTLCHICSKDGHTTITTRKGRVIVPYYMCEIFVKMSAADRFKDLTSKELCTVCLYPGARKGQHKCFFKDFCCPSHGQNDQIHVLVCDKHKSDQKNLEILEKFKKKFIQNCPVTPPNFVKGLGFFSGMVGFAEGSQTFEFKFDNLIPDTKDHSIFHLQSIRIGEISASFNLFFDNGCGDLVIKTSAMQRLASVGRAFQVIAGPLTIMGVGGQTCISYDGVYAICLPLANGQNAILSGLVLPTLTGAFPMYELSNVEKDIHQKCQEPGGPDISKMPKLPKMVGGDTDFLIGSKYLRYFPKEVHRFESGLTICESLFLSSDGSRGIVGGPHKDWEKFENSSGVSMSNVVYHATTQIVRQSWNIQKDIPLLGDKVELSQDDVDPPVCCEFVDLDMLASDSETYCENNAACVANHTPKQVRFFDEIENTGTEVTYRCVDCRECKKCKCGPRIEAISIQEEMEQNLVEQCVLVDLQLSCSIARLPFLVDPLTHLDATNEHVARKVFNSQLKILNSNQNDKRSVLDFEQKLQDSGYVDYYSRLSESEQQMIASSPVKYFISWRPVYKEDSVTTPCRLAFDASMSSKGACSLNSILAKGANSLNNLQAITIRWTTHPHVFHTDVQKMYNRVLLDSSHWCYQMYLFSKNLDIGDTPEWKVIKTLIYGVRPSGSLAECALRRTVELCKDIYPLAYDPIMHDTYMDDCASGTESLDASLKVMDEIEAAVGKGGFTLKGFTISGSDPPPHLTLDGKSVIVFGGKWFPKGDFYTLNINEQNFTKKYRGRKVGKGSTVPDVLTLTNCVSRVAEIFDLLGKVAPIIGGLKLDISKLHRLCNGWNDPIPNELKECWAANFDLINELRSIEFKRAIVPINAVDMNMELICVADAGESLVCAAVYARFLLKDGSYSCQHVFARTKVVHDHTTPRAELVAAVLNASTAFVVKSSLKERVKRCWHVTDSQVALYLINSMTAVLKTWPRNRVVEITRLTEKSEWRHTKRENMVADLGTRKGATVQQVSPGSPWIEGQPWMRGDPSTFPLSTIDDIRLTAMEKSNVNKEKVLAECNAQSCLVTYVPKEVEERFRFSNYLVNPNKYRFTTVVSIVALVFLFIEKASAKLSRSFGFLKARETRCTKSDKYIVFPIQAVAEDKVVDVAVVIVPRSVMACAEEYYFRKAAAEVQQFVDARKYKQISVLKDEILYFTGRILPSQKVDGKFTFSDAMLDLCESSFCVPITDALSPIAYAVVSETHWYDPDINHKGVETTLRFAQNTAHIIGGRDLAKMIRKSCAKCRILHKKGVQVAMGPIADESLNIAPPFYCSQVDICGHFDAFSPANKRATLKIWVVVFACTATCAVDCRIMESYDTESFLLAFVRFSCRFGYPKLLMPDEGSQLVKGCKDMVISFSDISQKLSTEYGVEFKTCPVGAHYVHGKVERKIQQVKQSLEKTLHNHRISILQWETLIQQISNSINNLPIGLGNLSDSLEHIDVITPNRLILGRNNSRSPNIPLQVSGDFRKIIESNNKIFELWFREWLISYVPTLVRQPKWFSSDRNVVAGDVVIFKKSEKEFDKTYQYGIVSKTFEGRDGLIRSVEIQYQNFNEDTKRFTKRGVRDIVVIHPVDEIGVLAELDKLANDLKE